MATNSPKQSTKATVLLADDDSMLTGRLTRALERRLGDDIEFVAANSVDDAVKQASSKQPDVCVVDLSIDDAVGPDSGLELIGLLLNAHKSTRIIVLTGHSSVHYGVEALKRGAGSFLEKPADENHLAALVQDALKVSALKQAAEALSPSKVFEALGLESKSEKMQKALEKAAFFSTIGEPVLLVGETGVGKGVFSNAMHRASGRKGSFCRLQPGFHSHDLIVSELVGHMRGAFTGADSMRTGLLEQANNGTLFLDEVDQLPHETQVFLLQTLQEKTFTRLGSTKTLKSDFWIIAATNRTLAEVKTSGSLRSDFFHRIAHAVIEIPPLRERIADIEPLASQFVNDVASKDNLPVVGLSDEASAYLRSQSWPGNVRQLQTRVTVATRHAHFENRTEVTPQDFVAFGEGEDSTLKHFSLKEQLHEHEYQVVKEALALHDGNIAHTAAYLKCDRKKIYTVIARHEGRGGEE